MSDVRQWLESLGLGQYGDAFEKNAVEWGLLAKLSGDELKEIGVGPLGHRKRILEAATTLDTGSVPPQSSAAPSGGAERRHLTVMFCDLVGSTALSARMDPEEYRELLAGYQSAARTVIERYDGYIARYMGDGLLVYFGYPQAHEDDAERAVRSGLETVQAVGALNLPDKIELKVRIGIATGLVVAGDVVGEGASQERAVLGDTPNLAARLQGIAEPNEVMLADSTRRLVEGRFMLEALEPQVLKGIPATVTAFRALSVRAGPSRFEAAHPGRLTPLTGRDGELSLLMEYWDRAREGEGQVVVLEGEPGIGKSRLGAALHDRIEAQATAVRGYQCSAYHSASAFHPVIEVLERAASFASTDDADTKLEKLEASLREHLVDDDLGLALVAGLLSLPTARYPPLNMTPQRQRAETIAVLVRQLEAMSRSGPLLILFEDAHWCDPSTLEFLDLVIDRLQSLSALALVMSRPGFMPRWTAHGHVSTHSLNRLGRRAITGMVENVAQGTTLSPEILEAIIGKADGVPLFVEELTKSVIESTITAATGQAHARTEPLSPLSIPPTLHDALIARLDRLGSVKEVAQLGACIGRVFSYEILAAVSPLPPNEVDAALSQLVTSELVLRREAPPDATYTFKHALLRDVAEESLLRSQSQQLHAQIASALQKGNREVAAEQLALHYAKGGLGAQAVQCYIQAGQSALARSAYREALVHLNAGWAISATLPDGLDTKRQALALHSTRAEALTASQGYAGSETTDAYKSAYQLCNELGNSSDIFPLLRGLYNTCNSQGRLRAARDIATRCLNFARRQNDPAPLSLAYRLLGQNEFLMGEFQAAGEHLLRALELYDEQAHADSAETYGLDLKSAPLKYVPLILWLQGYPDQALERLTENLTHGRDLGFAFNLALTRMWAYYLCMLRNEVGAAREIAIALDSLAREHEIPDCVTAAQAQLALAQCLIDSGKVEELTCAAERFSTYRDTWGEFVVPFNLGTLATAYARHDRPDEALRTIDAALAVVNDTEERWSEAELWRIKGQIHLAISRCRIDEAKECFLKSLEIARRQGARSWELRTATSFARLLIVEGDVTGAHQLLEPIYEWFTEGFDTLDFLEAKALIEDLS